MFGYLITEVKSIIKARRLLNMHSLRKKGYSSRLFIQTHNDELYN